MTAARRRKRKKKDRGPPSRRLRRKQETHRAKTSRTEPLAASTPPSPTVTGRQGASTVVALAPLSPIIVRSGRPMQGRTDADPARFPPPSTVAGCIRTAWARAARLPLKTPPDDRIVSQLRRISISGPLLLAADGRILVSRPSDAHYLGNPGAERCLRSAPRRFAHGCGADLPEGLLPVHLRHDPHVQAVGKPAGGPAWWCWDDLLSFRRGEDIPHSQLSARGWSPPVGDLRTHISVDRGRGAAATSGFFQTEGLDLEPVDWANPDGSETPSVGSLRLLVRCTEPLNAALVHLGGKRRLAALEPESETRWPTPPHDWMEQIRRAGGISLTLLTPGVFSDGYRPGWLGDNLIGSPPSAPRLRLRLRGAALERWQPTSGWDLARRRPKPMRKLVPVGATFWFDFLDGVDIEILHGLWLESVCDDTQDRRDGFGLALPGPWIPPADDSPA